MAKCKVTAIFTVAPSFAVALICAMEHATLHIQHTLLPSQFEAFNAEFITGKGENFAALFWQEIDGEGRGAKLSRVIFSNLVMGV